MKPDDQNRDGRIVGTVVVVAADHQIVVGIQFFQPGQKSIPFFKSGVSATVNTQRKKTSLFQKSERLFQCLDAGLRTGSQGMIPAWKIPEVKNNTAYTVRLYVISHMGVGFQKQGVIGRGIFTEKLLTGSLQCLFLNIEGQYLTVRACQAGEKQGIIAISIVASIQMSPSFTCSSIIWNTIV